MAQSWHKNWRRFGTPTTAAKLICVFCGKKKPGRLICGLDFYVSVCDDDMGKARREGLKKRLMWTRIIRRWITEKGRFARLAQR